MEAKELRQGNYITQNGTDDIYIVCGIFEDNSISVKKYNDNSDIRYTGDVSEFEPVELNPDIIKQLGFYKDPKEGYSIVVNGKLLNIDEDYFKTYCFYGILIEYYGYKKYIRFKYLHKLQNFASYMLVGELELKTK